MKQKIVRSMLLLFIFWLILVMIQEAEADEWFAILKYEACNHNNNCINVELRSDPSDYMSCVVHGEMIALNDLHKNRGKINHVVKKWSCEISKPYVDM